MPPHGRYVDCWTNTSYLSGAQAFWAGYTSYAQEHYLAASHDELTSLRTDTLWRSLPATTRDSLPAVLPKRSLHL